MDLQNSKYHKMIEDTDKRMKGLIAKWVLRYDYFGFLFSLVRRVGNPGLPHPMAIAPAKDGVLELEYNPILVSSTSDHYLHVMLHHEGLHILNKHISRMMRLLADLPKIQHEQHMELINIAADCAVNDQGNLESPLIVAGTTFVLHFPKDHKLKSGMSMEQYYYILLDRMRKNEDQNGKNQNSGGGKDNKNNNDPSQSSGKSPNGDQQPDGNGNEEKSPEKNDGDRKKGSGGGAPTDNENVKEDSQGGSQGGGDNSDLGNHENWYSDEIVDPHATSRNIDTYTRRIIRESARNFQRTAKARGRLPGYLQDLIEAALKPPPVPYYEIIRQLVRGSRLGKYKRSHAHVNRKRSYVFVIGDQNIPIISPFPGRKRDMSFKIGVIIDTSGSQSPDDILEGLSGCKNLIEKDPDCETTVLEVDTKIHNEYKLKRVDDINFEVKGRGGTTLYPGIARCKELKVDVCLCFTDGYTENFNEMDRRVFPKRMIWAVTPRGSEENLNQTGFVVKLPERNN